MSENGKKRKSLIFVEKIVPFNNLENVSRLQRTSDMVESVMMTKSDKEPSYETCENRSSSIDLFNKNFYVAW